MRTIYHYVGEFYSELFLIILLKKLPWLNRMTKTRRTAYDALYEISFQVFHSHKFMNEYFVRIWSSRIDLVIHDFNPFRKTTHILTLIYGSLQFMVFSLGRRTNHIILSYFVALHSPHELTTSMALILVFVAFSKRKQKTTPNNETYLEPIYWHQH